MFNLIPISLLIIALGGVVYIFSYHLSELEDDENSADSGFSFKAKFADFVNRMPLDSFKSQSLSITQKLLHRVRILLLKSDNRLMYLIGKISKKDNMTNGNGTSESGEQSQNSDNFWNDLSNPKQEETPEPTAPSFDGGEVKINLVVKSDPAIKTFDIQPAKISSEIPKIKLIKKSLKTKKSSK
ncbi:MAG: hypothetical protein Q7K16_03745 [Candidatus Azambacteria bacterium]|nr:hypothetical protein [Candidatus Azambacteria bacterium]